MPLINITSLLTRLLHTPRQSSFIHRVRNSTLQSTRERIGISLHLMQWGSFKRISIQITQLPQYLLPQSIKPISLPRLSSICTYLMSLVVLKKNLKTSLMRSLYQSKKQRLISGLIRRVAVTTHDSLRWRLIYYLYPLYQQRQSESSRVLSK